MQWGQKRKAYTKQLESLFYIKFLYKIKVIVEALRPSTRTWYKKELLVALYKFCLFYP
jgi:hypothetical protein